MANFFRSVLETARAILQSKTVTAGTTATTISPDTGYDGLSSVTVNPTPSQTKTATPTTSQQTISPDSGKLLSSVTVNAVSLSGDAAVGNVLSGKTFYNTSLTKQTGTMTNNGAVSPSGLNCGGSYTVPEGYHDGTGVVTANSLASQTGVDSGKTAVTAGAMLSGYQGWVNGSKVSGTVSSKAAATYNTSTSDQTIAAGQYLSGAQTIRKVTTANISAGNIKTGVTVKVGDTADDDRITGVAGTFTAASTVSSGQTAAAAAQLLTGYSAWVAGAEVKGSMANNGAVSPSALNCGGSYTIPAGYHNGSGVVTANSLANQTSATAAVGDIRSGKTAYVNGSKLTGTLADYSSGNAIRAIFGSGNNKCPAIHIATVNPKNEIGGTTVGSAEFLEVSMPAGIWAWSWGNSSCCLPTQTKSVTAPATGTTTVSADGQANGSVPYYLKSVTVSPTPSETKTATPSTSAQDITPTSGKLLSKVTVSAIATETKSQAASTSNIDVTPTSGKYLTKVTVTPQVHSGSYPSASTYTEVTSTSGQTIDLTATHNQRYIRVKANQTHSGTASATITANNTSGYDLGASHTFRYIKVNVPSFDLSEAPLWINSSPTSSFAEQTITLSNEITKYNYILIAWRVSTSINDEYSVITKVSDFIDAAVTKTGRTSLTAVNDYRYYRTSYYVSDTTLRFQGAYSHTGTLSNGYCIPLRVSGIAKLPYANATETTIWTNPNPGSSSSIPSFTANVYTLDTGKFSEYTYLKFVWKDGGSSAANYIGTEQYIIVPQTQFAATKRGTTTTNCDQVLIGCRRWSASFARRINWESDTTFYVTAAQRVYGDTTTSAAEIIPLRIIGIK